LGSIGSATNKVGLKNVNVTHILTVAGKLAPAHPADFVYKVIDGMFLLLFLIALTPTPVTTLTRYYFFNQ